MIGARLLHIISMPAEHPIGASPVDSRGRQNRWPREFSGSLNQVPSLEPLGERVCSSAEGVKIMCSAEATFNAVYEGKSTDVPANYS